MADEANTQTAATPAADAKKKTTIEGMTGYRTFATPDDASAFLQKCGEDYTDFADQPFALVGVGDDGTFDPALYTDDTRVRVAVLKNVPRTVNGKREATTIKAIVVTPVPTLDSLLSDDAGTAWVQKIIDKELNHVAVRPLRDAENLETAMEMVPTTRDSFITSSRDVGGIMDSYNDLYKVINDKMAGQVTIWGKARLIKAELKKAMESTAYALEYYPALEDRGEGKDSLFVLAIKFGQALCKHKGLAPDIFDKWLATRDQQALKASADQDEDDDLSLDDLVADMGDEATDSTDGAAQDDNAAE